MYLMEALVMENLIIHAESIKSSRKTKKENEIFG